MRASLCNGASRDCCAYYDGCYRVFTKLPSSSNSQKVFPDDRLPRFHWYPSPEAFTKSGARHFWGVTCGMNEETRDHLVDQIDLSIADDLDPGHDLVD